LYPINLSLCGSLCQGQHLVQDDSVYAVLSQVSRACSHEPWFRSQENNPFYGKTHTKDTKEKMRKPKKNTDKMGKHFRSQSQRDFNRLQMLTLHSKRKTCEKCGREFDL